MTVRLADPHTPPHLRFQPCCKQGTLLPEPATTTTTPGCPPYHCHASLYTPVKTTCSHPVVKLAIIQLIYNLVRFRKKFMPHICQNEQWQCAFMKTMDMLKPVLVTTKSWRCSDFQSEISFTFLPKVSLKISSGRCYPCLQMLTCCCDLSEISSDISLRNVEKQSQTVITGMAALSAVTTPPSPLNPNFPAIYMQHERHNWYKCRYDTQACDRRECESVSVTASIVSWRLGCFIFNVL